uniref:G-protein coupled receptors family 1 profile domain-containing protein n=1 Tax=Photinus pyralis TaxID=7054 RepID=A0A1Y1LPF2_PHOPY
MGSFLCKAVHYIQNLSTSCSVLTLTAISIERYYAIVHPMRAKYVCTNSQAKRIIAFTWCLAILLAIPILCVQVQMEVGDRFKAHWCIRDWDNESLWKFHEVYMLLLVLIGPTCIMSCTYTLICWEIWKVMEQRNVMTSRTALSRNRIDRDKYAETIELSNSTKAKSITKSEKEDTRVVKQVVYMLVAVVVLFAICWGPLLIDNVLTAYNVLPKQRTGYLKYMGTTFHLMAYFNR